MLSGWRFWIGLAISAVCLWLAFRGLDFAETWTFLSRANYLYVVPALGAYFIGVWFRAVRWHYLLRPIKPVPSGRLFPVVVIGYAANDVLPARMGEVARAFVFGRQQGVSSSATLGTIAVERIFDGIAMLSFMASVAAVAPFPEELRAIAGAATLVFVVLVGLLMLAAFYSDAGTRLIGLVLGRLPGGVGRRAGDVAGKFFEGLRSLRSARLLLLVYAFSLLAWLWEALMYYLIALGFGLELPPHAFLLTVAAANLATLAPSSPGYVGPFDAAAIFVLTLFGAARELAAGYTLALHVVLIVPVTLLGFYYLWRDHLTLHDVTTSEASSDARSVEVPGHR